MFMLFDSVETQSGGIQPIYSTQTDYSCTGPLLSTQSMPSSVNG